MAETSTAAREKEQAESAHGHLKPKAPKPYLEKDFGVELNYKMWTTKGVRFVTARRLLARHNWSVYTIGALSVYVILLGLAFSFGIMPSLSQQVSSFAITAMSLAILVFSQFELSKEFSLRSHQHHECALAIAELYNEWRWVKTNDKSAKKSAKIRDLSKRYSAILSKHENHDHVDWVMFQAIYCDYFEVGWFGKLVARLRYYVNTYLYYQLAIALPPLVLVVWILWN